MAGVLEQENQVWRCVASEIGEGPRRHRGASVDLDRNILDLLDTLVESPFLKATAVTLWGIKTSREGENGPWRGGLNSNHYPNSNGIVL